MAYSDESVRLIGVEILRSEGNEHTVQVNLVVKAESSFGAASYVTSVLADGAE